MNPPEGYEPKFELGANEPPVAPAPRPHPAFDLGLGSADSDKKRNWNRLVVALVTAATIIGGVAATIEVVKAIFPNRDEIVATGTTSGDRQTPPEPAERLPSGYERKMILKGFSTILPTWGLWSPKHASEARLRGMGVANDSPVGISEFSDYSMMESPDDAPFLAIIFFAKIDEGTPNLNSLIDRLKTESGVRHATMCSTGVGEAGYISYVRPPTEVDPELLVEMYLVPLADETIFIYSYSRPGDEQYFTEAMQRAANYLRRESVDYLSETR